MQNDRQPLVRRERADCLERRVQRIAVTFHRDYRRHLRPPLRGTTPPLMPEVVNRAVDDDPFQPRCERTLRVEAVETLKRLCDRLLRRLVREHPISEDSVSPLPRQRPEPMEELANPHFGAGARERSASPRSSELSTSGAPHHLARCRGSVPAPSCLAARART